MSVGAVFRHSDNNIDGGSFGAPSPGALATTIIVHYEYNYADLSALNQH